MRRHVIVISNDALVYDDLAYLQKLPNFSRIWDQTARVERVRSVYPSLTYPCHVTLMTGNYPARHGIVHNEMPTLLCRQSDWHTLRKDVRGSDLFDVAKAAGLRTAAVSWPVTGNHPSIDYLINECSPQTADESVRDCYVRMGSCPAVLKNIVDVNLHLHRAGVHPYYDAFVYGCACSIIRAYQPNLLMIHPANIDGYRHSTGVFSDLVLHGLHEIDAWLGDIVKACEDTGIYEETDFFLVSDHGQLNIKRTLSLNAVLSENGLIDVNANGDINDFTAFAKSCALSAQIYLKDPEDEAARKRTQAVLQRLCDDGVYGIRRVYTAAEAASEEHVSGGFSFMLEGDGFTAFDNDWHRPLVRSAAFSDYRVGRATHGHQPDKGPQPTLMAFGPHIRAGVSLDQAALVDEAPTFARVLGLHMGDTDGTCLDALLRDC